MRQPALLEHLPWRVAGVILLGVLVVVYQPDTGTALQRVAIPAAMAVATWLMVQNVAAVAIGAGALAAIHSAPGSADWVTALAYPAMAAACGAILLVVFVRRFRRRIADTHEARWRHRAAAGGRSERHPQDAP
jgi:cell division protein FtsW (lipid II flippase)